MTQPGEQPNLTIYGEVDARTVEQAMNCLSVNGGKTLGEMSLGERMKMWERHSRYQIQRRAYIIIRVDGRSFHTWTRGLKRPYDQTMVDAMAATAQHLAEEVGGAVLGYTQSDEISIIAQDFRMAGTEPWFAGSVQKIASVAAAEATAAFNAHWQGSRIPATFDGRVFTVYSAEEAANYMLWRKRDAMKNAITMVAEAGYSHKELHRKNTTDRLEMIHRPEFEEKTGLRLSDLDLRFMYGQLVTRETYSEFVSYFDKRTGQQVTTDAPVERRRWESRPLTTGEAMEQQSEAFLPYLPEIPRRDRAKQGVA